MSLWFRVKNDGSPGNNKKILWLWVGLMRPVLALFFVFVTGYFPLQPSLDRNGTAQ
jgi:hypothetical protein